MAKGREEEEEEEGEEEGEEERQDEEDEGKGHGGIRDDYTVPFSQIHCLKKSGYRQTDQQTDRPTDRHTKPLIEMRGRL